jgi:RNA polymerase sigma-70 factor (ECF subfamily)
VFLDQAGLAKRSWQTCRPYVVNLSLKRVAARLPFVRVNDCPRKITTAPRTCLRRLREFGTLRAPAGNAFGVTTSRTDRTDADLVAAAAAGDRDAFAALYLRHHLGVYRFARTMTGSTTAAEDVTQEVFLAFMQGPDRFDESRGALSTYLFGVARNVSRHRLRKEIRLVAQDDQREGKLQDPDDDPAQVAIRHESSARVRRYIRGLSSRYREVVILCDLEELTYEDAAKVLGTRVGTVRSRLHRARQMLAERLMSAGGHRSSDQQGLRWAI